MNDVPQFHENTSKGKGLMRSSGRDGILRRETAHGGTFVVKGFDDRQQSRDIQYFPHSMGKPEEFQLAATLFSGDHAPHQAFDALTIDAGHGMAIQDQP